MKSLILCFIIIVICCTSSAQSPFNLDMEVRNNSTGLPVGWVGFGDKTSFTVKSDSINKQHGNYSLSVEIRDGSSETYASATYSLKAIQAGKKISVKGYIKTENVQDGYAGLFIYVKAASKTGRQIWLSSADMEDKGIKGTTDWQPFILEIDYDEEDADSIHLGVELAGSGKVWLDNVSLKIDDKDISLAPVKKVHLAILDTALRFSSGIASLSLNEQQTENLTNLGMLWGFLKYHHPAIAKGNFNWDAELFRVLPQLLSAKNKTVANKVFEDWVDKLGKVEKCIKCVEIKKDEKIKLMPDYGNLFTKGNLSPSLISKLGNILVNRNSGKHFYIDMGSTGSGRPPDFRHEELYPEMVYPDAGYRLLTLYRYWNIIQYFYPNRHLIGEDWNKVLKEFIPGFANARDSIAYSLSCAELVARIHDSHASGLSRVLDGTFGKYQVPLQLALIDDEIVVTGYYSTDSILREKIKLGDIVKKIDGKPVLEIINKHLPIIGASNYPRAVRNLRSIMLRGDSLTTTWKIARDGKLLTAEIDRMVSNKLNTSIDRDPYPGDSSFKIIDGNIGYIFPGKYKNSQLNKIKDIFKETQGIIIDFRCYPSEPFTFVPWLKPDSSAFIKYSFGNAHTPGLFTFSPEIKSGKPNKDYYKGKVVVIVNETTISQAEYNTMAIQSAPNVTVIGSITAGADGNVSRIYLPGNIMTGISGIGVYYPDGTETQRVGVRIDIPAKPTIKGIKEGRDELLEKAIAIIQASK